MFMLLPVAAPWAQTVRIGVVDLQKVYNENSSVDSIKAELKTLTEKHSAEVQKLEQQLAERFNALKAKRGVISEEEYQREYEEIKTQSRAFREKVQELQNSIDQRNIELKKGVTLATMEVIKTVAQKNNLDIVLPDNFVLYADPAMNITADVMDGVNKKLKDAAK